VDVQAQTEAERRVALEDHRRLDVRRELEVVPVQHDAPAQRKPERNVRCSVRVIEAMPHSDNECAVEREAAVVPDHRVPRLALSNG